jgi:type III secretory pathway component EscV
MKPQGPPQKLLFIFIFLSLFLFQSQLPAKSQQQQNSEKQLVRNVTLVDEPEWIKEKNKNDHERLPLPNPLIIGIDMNKEAIFKLTTAESKSTAAAGTLSQGKNTIALPTDELFRKSGSHTYILQVKAGEIEQEKIFILEIRIESDSSGSFSDMVEESVKVRNRIYEVSMFVDRKHIASIQKTNTLLYGLLKDALEKRVDRAYDPAPLPNSRPPAFGISPLTLAAMAYKALKKRKERKKREKIRHIYVKQLSGGFYRKDQDGKEKPLDMTIKINSPQSAPKKK